MSIYLQLLFVALAVIFIVDLSGFRETILEVASRVAGKRIRELRPFTCSLCMTFWTTLVFAIATGYISLPVAAYCCLLSFASDTIAQAAIFIRECLKALLRWAADKLKL